MRRRLALVLAVVAVPVPAAIAQQPDDPVATIGGAPAVTAAEVDHWTPIVERRYGTTTPDHAARAVQQLLQARWDDAEATARGVGVSEAEARENLAFSKREAYEGDDAAWQAELERSGMREEDKVAETRAMLLRLRVLGTHPQPPAPTVAEARAHYEQHKEDFVDPPRRDVRLLTTTRRAQAVRALRRLQAGRLFGAVARHFSTDRTLRRDGGVWDDAFAAGMGAELGPRVFAARTGRLVGTM